MSVEFRIYYNNLKNKFLFNEGITVVTILNMHFIILCYARALVRVHSAGGSSLAVVVQ